MTENQPNTTPIKKRKWTRAILIVLLLIFLLPLTLTLAIQIPAIQNWTKDQFAKYIYKKYSTEVHIGSIDMDVFQHIYLQDLVVLEPSKDTLIVAKLLEVNIQNGLFGMFSSDKVIKELNLSNGFIQVDKFEDGTNFDRIFKNKNSNKNTAPISATEDSLFNEVIKEQFLRVEKIHLDQVELNIHNFVKNSIQNFKFHEGTFLSNYIDMNQNIFRFDDVDLKRPIISITKLPNTIPVILTDTLETKIVYEGEPIIFSEQLVSEKPFELVCNHLTLEEGHFIMNNQNFKPRTGPGIDYKHLNISNISVDADTFYNRDWDYGGRLKHFSGVTEDGFEISDLYCDQVTVTPQKVDLASFTLQTPKSILNDTLQFFYEEYLDFEQFVDYVRMDASFKNSRMALKDLMYLVPDLNNVQFFQDNKNEFLILSGKLNGPINRFRGQDLTLYLGDKVVMNGKFSSRDLAIKDGALINLDLKSIKTNLNTIRQIFPSIEISENFNKLGDISFKGKFDGYFQDFVAYGELSTGLGNSIMDMRLNSTPGRDNAEYSGTIKVIEFDFGKWLDNPDLGFASFTAEVPSGKGLTLDGLNTVVDGSIEQLEFKGYNYRNAIIKGRLQKDLFDGELEISDQNIDLAFNGEIDFSDSIPHLDFFANIRKFDFEAVNLANSELVLSGNINLNIDDIDVNKFVGEINAQQILVKSGFKETHYLDSLLSYSYYGDLGKKLIIRSDLLDVDLEGNYLLTDMMSQVQHYLFKNFPSISMRLGLDSLPPQVAPMDYTVEVSIHDSKQWLKLLNVPIENIANAKILGTYKDLESVLTLKAVVPTIEYNQSKFNNLITQLDCNGPDCEALIYLDQSQLTEKNVLNSIESDIILHGDEASFSIRTEELFKLFNVIDLSGKAKIDTENYTFNLDPSKIILFGKDWTIDPLNSIVIKKTDIDLEYLELKHNSERIFIDDIGRTGLEVELENIPVGLIDSIWDYDQLNFSGLFRGKATIQNLKDWTTFNVDAFIDTLFVNGDNFGQTFITAGQTQKGQPIAGFLKLENDESRLTANGYIYPKTYNKDTHASLDFDLEVNNYPMKMFEYWLGGGISNTAGELDAEVKINGLVNNLQMNGDARVFKGQTTVNYLNTTYFFHDQPVGISTQLFDFSNVQISDELGNRADITGGIYHQFLANGGVDVRINAPYALVLNTGPDDNDLYYGKGLGKIDATFKGPFKSVDMYINAETAKGTELSIPISSGYTSYSGDFVTFIDFSAENKTSQQFTSLTPEGIDVKMDLSITEDAQVNIIFDERAGDIIKGNGRGAMQIEVARTGDMEIHGQYEIGQGDYLFTLYDIVNKPFEIKRGGTIRWSGDPYQAIIDLKAEYKGLNASLQPFLIEYSETISSDTRLNTLVQLNMHLTGDLFKPNIDFDVAFPNLTGELKNYADSKLNILRADPNALNQQVFGLIVLGSFIPSNSNPLGNQFISGSSVNTLSQLFSNQLSIYITELISEAVADNDFISGVDFDLGWNLNPELSNDAEKSILSGSEVQFRLNNRLFDDRLSFNVGANIVNNSAISSNYIAGVWGLEYYLTPDNRLKVRLYQQPEETLEGLKNKFGLGISFRKEFDSFFKKSTTEAIRKLRGEDAVGISN